MTMKDIAKLCNVSVSTVSKAFMCADDISEDTKQMIFSVAKENGCYEKYYKGKYHKFVVAVICPEIDSQYYARFTERLQEAIENVGGIMVVALDRFDKRRRNELVEYFSASNRADGLVVFGFTELKKGYDIPIISVGSTVSGVDSVVGNLADGIDKAVKHLVDLGHKRIAFVGEPLTTGKRDVFLQSLAKYNVFSRAEDIVMVDSRFENAGFIGARRLIENKTECTAIVCAYDYIAIGVMRYLEQEGYKIPEDFSVIGMDNIDTSKYLAQSLTTIDAHLEEVCTVVADLMAKKVKNRWVSAKQQIKLSSDLIIRESTGPVKE